MISVVGSINADFVINAQRRPSIGETVFGEDFHIYPGGKGANQAVAIAKLGGNVQFFGCVGDDVYAKLMIDNLKKHGINTDYVQSVKSVSTGVAVITLADGDNSIIVVKGANEHVDIEYIDRIKPKLIESEYVLLQNEIPFQTVEYVVELCYKEGIHVILNPAPACELKDGLIEKIKYITPNEHEALMLLRGYSSLDALLQEYPEKIIVTLGARGAAYYDGQNMMSVPAMPHVRVVDTTGAGDTFSGAFIKAISDGTDIKAAIEFAQCASGMSIEKRGAQEGMPTLLEVRKRCQISDWRHQQF